MCRFLSGVVTQDGVVHTSPVDDSHENIIAAEGIRECRTGGVVNIVRVEYTSNTLADIDTYKLAVDQDEIPDWFDDDMRERVTGIMHRMAASIILTTGEHKCLLGGKWILAGDVVVKRVVGAYVVGMCGSSQVGVMYGSSQVGVMCDSSRVGEMCGSSQVGEMYGSSRVVSDRRVK